MQKLAIIMPAYNEERRIGKTLEAYSDYFELLRKQGFLDYEILVVINNTKDSTEEIVKTYQKSNPRINYINLIKGGKGYAVIEGFKAALLKNFDLIGFVDADLATGPESYYYLLKNINNADAIIANRYDQESKITPKFTFRRLIVAKAFNLLVRALFFFPFQDTQCGAKLFTKRAANLIVTNVKMSQWAFDIELLYLLKKNGLKINEARTIWKDMEGSKLDLKKASIQMIFSVLQLRIITSPFKELFKPLKPLAGLFWRLIK